MTYEILRNGTPRKKHQCKLPACDGWPPKTIVRCTECRRRYICISETARTNKWVRRWFPWPLRAQKPMRLR